MIPRNGNPELTILIAAHNREAEIEAALHPILEQDYPMERVEILLVADRCTDGTVARARAMVGETLRVIEITEPPQTLTARQAALHAGIEAARGEVVLIAEADGRIPREWVHEISGHLSFRDGAVTGPVIYAGTSRFFARWQTLDGMVSFGLAAWMSNHGMAAPVMGGNLAVQRDAYLETGGFPAIGFAPSEDFALGVRLRRSGWTVRYLNDPATRVPAATDLRSLLTHAHRRDHAFPWFFGFAYGLGIASFAVLFACAATMHGVWWLWFALRYGLGMAMTAMGVALCGSYGLLKWIWLYEPVTVVLSIWIFIEKRILRKPWKWQGVAYGPEGPVGAAGRNGVSVSIKDQEQIHVQTQGE